MMNLKRLAETFDEIMGLMHALGDHLHSELEHVEEPPLQAAPQKRRQPCPRCGGDRTIETGQACPICMSNAGNPRTEGLDPPEDEPLPTWHEIALSAKSSHSFTDPPPASSPIPGMSAEEYADRMARAAHSREQHRRMYGKRSPFAKDDDQAE